MIKEKAMKRNFKLVTLLVTLLLVMSMCLTSCDVILAIILTPEHDQNISDGSGNINGGNIPDDIPDAPAITLDTLPDFDGETAFVEINKNIPYFTDEEKVTKSYEYYGDLDGLGRCTMTVACVGLDIMPTEDRGSIGSVKPTGWQSIKYDFISGKYLYNRCHLIGYQLTGENANKKNLITGTRFLNIEGMLPFEDMIADYVKETGNHVMYRATPIFDGDDLLARGVLMEGWSVEDNGDGICFNVFAYNCQPYVEIDYATGNSTPLK